MWRTVQRKLFRKIAASVRDEAQYRKQFAGLRQMDDAIKRMEMNQRASQFGQDLAFRNQQLSEQGAA
jgi:hypothetical protein